ncbi:MAG TPA: hypothetical protein VHZ28_03050 [Terracidiphilus sp.]|nr:hypothetical protein [Terracidiphilus sp.]
MSTTIKSAPATWHGDLILACRKCQKKLKGEPGMNALAKLKKTIRKRSKDLPKRALHVINVPCMDLCPKGGVTLYDPARDPNRLAILYSEKEIDTLST